MSNDHIESHYIHYESKDTQNLKVMDFGEEEGMSGPKDKYRFFSHHKRENQVDFINSDYKMEGQLEKTSAKNKETPCKMGESQEKLFGNGKTPFIKQSFTLAKFEEIAAHNFEEGLISRQIYDEEKHLQKKKKAQHCQYISVAQFKAIQQDRPDIINQSVEYLSQLTEQYELSKHTKKTLSKEGISVYFHQLLNKAGIARFYVDSIQLLETHLLKIIQEIKKSSSIDHQHLQIQIQILSYFLIISWEFNDYIPIRMQANICNVNLFRITKLLKFSLPQLNILKKLFIQNHHRLTFLDASEFKLKQLLTTYYLIILKHKFKKFSPQILLRYSLQKTVHHYKANKLQMSEKINRLQIEQKVTLTSLYRIYESGRVNQHHEPSSQRALKGARIFEDIILSHDFIRSHEIIMDNWDHPKLTQMSQQFKIKLRIIQLRFREYVERKKSLLARFNNDLSNYKNVLITKQLISNPQCSYEQTHVIIYMRTGVYIEPDYFQDNLFSLLLNEVQYQQFKYLGRVFKGISECIRQDKSVIFIDYCSFNEGEAKEREQENPSVSIAVTLKGALLYKTSIQTVNRVELLNQYRQIFQQSSPSIIILFIDEFPFSREPDESEDVYFLRKSHILLFLPRISLVPNPCKAVAEYLKVRSKQKSNRGEELKSVIENTIQELDEKQVKEIVDKEWEKSQKFASTCNSVLRNEQTKEQPNSTDAKEGEQMIGEFEGQMGFEGIQDCPSNDFKELNEQENEKLPIEQPLEYIPSQPSEQKVEAMSKVSSLQPIMENLQSKSIEDLRTVLAHLLLRNKKNPFLKNGNNLPQIGKKFPLQAVINQNKGIL